MNVSSPTLTPFACSLAFLATLVPSAPVAAQDDPVVTEALATLLAAEDARQFNAPLFRSASRHPDALVRRRTALAIGRIGDRAGTRVLTELATDPDSGVQADAVFALGLVGDPRALGRLREILLDSRPDGVVFDEAAAATARIGGRPGSRLVSELLSRWVGLASSTELPSAVVRALGEVWRLGDSAPVRLALQFAVSPDRQVRRNVVYSLGRLQAPDGVTVLFGATEDRDPVVRSYAARALRAEFADGAGLQRQAAARRIEPLINDSDRRVRIEALRSIATFGGHDFVRAVVSRTTDPDPNVRVTALATLGEMEGPDAAMAVREQLTGGIFAIEREALISYARIDPVEAMPVVEQWALDGDWRERAAAAEALRASGSSGIEALRQMTTDGDPRVLAAVTSALLAVDTANAPALARSLVGHADEVVRGLAYDYLSRSPRIEDLELFVAGYRTATTDRGFATRAAIIRALGKLSGQNDEYRGLIEDRFLTRFPSNTVPRDRQVAQDEFQQASLRWGGARPVVTTRAIADYRDLVRDLILPTRRGERPQMVIETDRGTITIDLLPEIAPLAVRAFSELIDRRYFDGGAWHRVVPNFVVQDGDPRGDGMGSPGFSIRDEVSRIRYGRGTVGVARTQRPDTGGSQFFITLSPQPHLEGSYTIFGTVRSGSEVLDRITLGDRIRRIRRIDH